MLLLVFDMVVLLFIKFCIQIRRWCKAVVLRGISFIRKDKHVDQFNKYIIVIFCK